MTEETLTKGEEALVRILRENIASSIQLAFECARENNYLNAGFWLGLAACDVLRFPRGAMSQQHRADLLRHAAMRAIRGMQAERNKAGAP